MIVALVLAGGRGRRLGGVDKALLPLAGRPLLAHVLNRLAGQVERVAISANGDPERFAEFGVPVLGDGAYAGQGPLAGLLAGLDWVAGLGAEALLSVPCDTPFIPTDLVARLIPAPARVACAGQAHHALALWPVAARTALRGLLETAGSRATKDFAASLGMREVAFPAGAWEAFLNINTRDDLARAEAIARQRGE